MTAAPNRNTYYAETFVNALAKAGLQHVVIAPGSRSTPLTIAFAKHPDITAYSLLDERCVAFFALGMAMALDQPVAILCTSGTAAANFYGAIIEAYMSRVPLLVLTADRAHEARHSGANQTIDQVKMYGDNVLWSVDMALPENNPPAVAIRNLQTMAARALATANGQLEFRRKGPVHLNFPFRKPLEPIPVETDVFPEVENVVPEFILARRGSLLTEREGEFILNVTEQYENGIIVIGNNRWPNKSLLLFPLSWGSSIKYPVFAEPSSNGRFTIMGENDPIISGYDVILSDKAIAPQNIDVIIYIGDVPTSSTLLTYLSGVQAKYRLRLDFNEMVWRDDAHLMSHQFQMVELPAMPFPDRASSAWFTQWQQLETAYRPAMEEELTKQFFDGVVPYTVLQRLEDGATVFVGNSNSIRHMDTFVPRMDKLIIVYASRGASGIDGQVSTALGIAATTHDKHITVILGDITLYHDMNGLLAIQRAGVTATFIVVNNNGGGIFERLPIHDFEPYHTDFFLTPHGLTFAHTATLYGLEYAHVTDFETLHAALDQYLKPGISSIIEVQTDIKTDEARRKEVIRNVQERIRAQIL